MAWKRIYSKSNIKRIIQADQDAFKQRLRSHPKVDDFDLEFFEALDRVHPEFIKRPQLMEEDFVDPDFEGHEGDLSIWLKPGWINADEDSHNITAMARWDAENQLDNAEPCLCPNCVYSHYSHQNCTDPNWCAVLGNSQRSHKANNHKFCIPEVCDQVKKSHQTNHALCPVDFCETKSVIDAHARGEHGEFCTTESCPAVAKSHTTDHKLCKFHNPYCFMGHWLDLFEKGEK